MIISLGALDLLLHLLRLGLARRKDWLVDRFGWLVLLLFVVDLSQFIEI